MTKACAGPMDRRTWIQLGGLSLGALASGLPPSLPRLLAAESMSRNLDKDFSVILFWANGGPSHLDLFDMKPQAPSEYRGPFRPIRTNVPGMEITELLPNLAKLGDKISIIRSLKHDRNQHSGGTGRFLTGYSSQAANPADSEFPELGSVVAKHLEHEVADLPLFVANTKFYGGGPAYIGPAYVPFAPNANNPISSSGNNQYDPIPIYMTGGESGSLSISESAVSNLRKRQQLLKTFDKFRRDLDRTGNMSAVDKFNQRAIDMLASPRTRDAFDISKEDSKTRLRYGDTHWGRSLLTARRLVEAGSRFVQIQATYRVKPETGRTSNWDSHSVNSHIFDEYREKLPSFDQSVPALISDLYNRGLDKSVLFVFCGEFGRTPKIGYQDKSKRPGRDHWAQAMSVLVSGGGLKMGQVIGATGPKAEAPVERVMNSNCLLSTIYHRFGINTSYAFHDNTGRPVPILTEGEPIPELL